MKKILVAMSVLIASLFVITPAPAMATAPVVCSDARYVTKSYIGDTVKISVRANYRTCTQYGRKWVRLIAYQGSYRVKEGQRLTCNKWTHPFRAAWVNFYFWDPSGRNWNPSTFIIGCSSTGHNMKIFKAGTAPKLFFKDAWSPKWRATVKEELSTAYSGIPDNVAGVAGVFNPKV